MAEDEDELEFAPEDGENRGASTKGAYVVLVVDDDEDVHAITRMILKKMDLGEKSLEMVSTFSCKETLDYFQGGKTADLVLLDIVMESDDAGYHVAEYIRRQMNRNDIRIVVRTGQPGVEKGSQPELDYKLDGFFLKTEMSASRLREVVKSNLLP